MAESNAFYELIRRVRAGEQEAAAELVRLYEPAIRREVRFRLADRSLRRVFDSMDICQSVLSSFFVRAASGQYELDKPEHLLKLLVAMARNKLAFQVRKHRAQRRDNRRVGSRSVEQLEPVAAGASPSRVVAGRELLMEFRNRLSEEERQLADLRSQGCEWAQIAAELGGTPDARRKQLTRAIDRVAQQLGLEPD